MSVKPATVATRVRVGIFDFILQLRATDHFTGCSGNPQVQPVAGFDTRAEFGLNHFRDAPILGGRQ
jgi:hypothetical protein